MRRRIFELAGESHYQEVLRRARPGDRLSLSPEPSNPHDPAAIRVDTLDGATIGYVRRADTSALHPMMRRARVVKVHRFTGGVPDYPSIGCEISIAWDDKPEHPHKALAADQLAHIGRHAPREANAGTGLVTAIRRLLNR